MNLNPVTCKSFLFLIQMDVPLQQIVYRRVTVEDYLSAVMTFRPEFLKNIVMRFCFHDQGICFLGKQMDRKKE